MMKGRIKKPSYMASRPFGAMFQQVSKAALIDALWCACQLGTDETPEQIQSQAARNVVAALKFRQDRVPSDITATSTLPIESDQ